MKEYSIIFIKNPSSDVRQFNLGKGSLYGIFGFFFTIALLLGAVYFSQYQAIESQKEKIVQYQMTQENLNQKIASFSEKEARIDFLENYVVELKDNAFNSEKALKDHLKLVNENTAKLIELQNYVSRVLGVDSELEFAQSNDPSVQVALLNEMNNNFSQLENAIKEFAARRSNFQEQEATIKQLNLKIAQSEKELAEHIRLVKSKEKALQELSDRIQKVTGIRFDLETVDNVKKSESLDGRGGPSASDLELSSDLNAPDSYLQQYLQRSSNYYNSLVESFEGLHESIKKDSEMWLNTPTIYPVKSPRISDSYGKRIDPFTGKWDFHAGTDFTGKTGTEIHTPADGVVKKALRLPGYGNFVEIEHGPGFYKNKRKIVVYTTRYGHMNSILVKRGQKVKRNQVIGTIGNTGRSTGPHLHYEMMMNGRHLNPMAVLKHFNSNKR